MTQVGIHSSSRACWERRVGSVSGVLGSVDMVNLSKIRHGACSISEVHREGIALGIVQHSNMDTNNWKVSSFLPGGD